MADSHGEKTEKASAKRLKDARKRGQVARSRDLGVAVSSLAATGVLAATGAVAIRRLGFEVANALGRLGESPLRELRPDDLSLMVAGSGTQFAVLVGPVVLAAAGAGVLTAAAQGGFSFAPEALQVKWERLSPANGLSMLAPSRSGVDTLKSAIAVAALGMLAWHIGRGLVIDMPNLAWLPPGSAAERGWASTLRLLWQTGFALLAIGAADYGVQRWRLLSSLKMTRQEVRDELRSSEGSPEIRARVRRVQREMARRRMLHATAKATVVITNPTHFAVALEYRRDKSPAPVVVAKGRDLIAARMREVARINGVPIVENPVLARSLFKGAEVGDLIPAPLFGAVAEVLAYLIRIKQLML